MLVNLLEAHCVLTKHIFVYNYHKVTERHEQTRTVDIQYILSCAEEYNLCFSITGRLLAPCL